MQQRKPLADISLGQLLKAAPTDATVQDVVEAIRDIDPADQYTIEELVVLVNGATEDRIRRAAH